MQILISNAVQQTILFGIVFILIFLFSFKKKQNYTSFSLTLELKGFAMLTIIFGHIGYFLSVNQDFLYPFSILSGVGVNLFLFLSGYGLTASHMKKGESLLSFYKRRLPKLLIPFWIVLGTFLVLDFVILAKTYSIQFLFQAFFGIFTEANMLTDFNSPLWYFTLILFYYLVFPIVFSKKWPWITALLFYFIVWKVVQLDPPHFSGVIGLYEVHMLAFPLGILSAWLLSTQKKTVDAINNRCSTYTWITYPTAMITLLSSIAYFGVHSKVGDLAYLEERTSLFVMCAVLLVFIIKKRESKLFTLFGLFSYEIYLFHWPLLVRYDVLYTHLPASIATLLYLGIFILLAMALQKLSLVIFKKAGV